MILSIGQPDSLWQNGTPQSMQRAPCVRSSTSAGGVKISRKSCTRSSGSRYGTAWRSNSLKPVGLPILGNDQSPRINDQIIWSGLPLFDGSQQESTRVLSLLAKVCALVLSTLALLLQSSATNIVFRAILGGKH